MHIVNTLLSFHRMVAGSKTERTANLLGLSENSVELAMKEPDLYTVGRLDNNQYKLFKYTQVSDSDFRDAITASQERTVKKKDTQKGVGSRL